MDSSLELVKKLQAFGMSGYLFRGIAALVIAGLGWYVARYSQKIFVRLAKNSAWMDATITPMLGQLIRWGILAATAIAVLDKLGVETSSALAVLGALGLAIGLALKETLSDVASGIVLLVRRPFEVGHSVEVAARLGTVTELDIFVTKIISPDGIPIIIPNSKVRATEIRNFTKSERRRADLRVRVSYQADLRDALAVVESVAAKSPEVLDEPAPLVKVEELGEHAVHLLIRLWTLPEDHLMKTLELTHQIKDGLDLAGFGVPVQRRDIHLVQSQEVKASK